MENFKEDDLRHLQTYAQDKVAVITDIVKSLKEDLVVRVTGADQDRADQLISDVSRELNLLKGLQLQSSFASILGHRENMSRYYMSVNKRSNYHYIPLHSEGSSKTNIHMASMYCVKNDTDGGVTILAKFKQAEELWGKLGEYCIKVKPGHTKAARHQIHQAKTFFKVDIENDELTEHDQIISEIDQEKLSVLGLDKIGMKAYHVVSPIPKLTSVITGKNIYSYWDSVASHDSASGRGYYCLLKEAGLLREPNAAATVEKLDNANHRRVWDSEVELSEIIESKLALQLEPGEILFFNNMTWAHSSSNWTPHSGQRKVLAAFA